MDTLSETERSHRMSLIKSKGNKSTELALVRQFRRERLTGWRRNYDLYGKPDFVFPAQRVAVFVDGCFWHGCKEHRRLPKTNQDYWREKMNRNVNRDSHVIEVLRAKGWNVVRVWEHDIKNCEAFRTIRANLMV